MIVYFTKAFITNANLASLLITGHHKKIKSNEDAEGNAQSNLLDT